MCENVRWCMLVCDLVLRIFTHNNTGISKYLENMATPPYLELWNPEIKNIFFKVTLTVTYLCFYSSWFPVRRALNN